MLLGNAADTRAYVFVGNRFIESDVIASSWRALVAIHVEDRVADWALSLSLLQALMVVVVRSHVVSERDVIGHARRCDRCCDHRCYRHYA